MSAAQRPLCCLTALRSPDWLFVSLYLSLELYCTRPPLCLVLSPFCVAAASMDLRRRPLFCAPAAHSRLSCRASQPLTVSAARVLLLWSTMHKEAL